MRFLLVLIQNQEFNDNFNFQLLFLTIASMTSSSSSIDSSDLASSSLHLYIPSDFLSIHSAPVLCSSFNSIIHTVTMIVHFDVDNKGNKYQQFRFVLFFELTSLIRKQRNPSINSVFSYKSLQALGDGTQQIFKRIFDMILDIQTNNSATR